MGRVLRMNHLGVLIVALLAAGAAGCASAPATYPHPSPFPMAPGPARDDHRTGLSPQAASLIDAALALRGTRYQLGGTTPDTGFDCSGLVRYVYLQQTIALPRTVAEQARVGRRVERNRIEPGDLVFFSTTGRGATHVGIALDGERFIHAPDSGAVVRIERFDAPYWARRYAGTRRVL